MEQKIGQEVANFARRDSDHAVISQKEGYSVSLGMHDISRVIAPFTCRMVIAV